MTHKEFFVWLDGFMTNRCWTTIRELDIESIRKKMKEVKDDDLRSLDNDMTRPYPFIPIPVNPIPNGDDPIKPPFEITCNI